MGDPESSKRKLGTTMRLAGVGVELAATVGGLCLVGYWIDRHFATGPWGLVVCAFVGVVDGMYNMIRQAVHELLGVNEAQQPRKESDDRTDSK